MKHFYLVALLGIAIVGPAMASDQSTAADIAALHELIADMRTEYEARISDLESRLGQSENVVQTAQASAEEAFDLAEQTAIEQSSGLSNANTFNPAIGAILMGRYANIDQAWDEIPGFQPAGEIGSGESGFSLGESEINLKGSIDSQFFGNLTLGLHDDDGDVEVELEEAWVQSTALPAGLSLTGGRFFSAAGYLNSFHFHSDDFTDRPLPYQAFVGGRYSNDGVQARWVAPTDLLFELGAELNWGDSFPATSNADTSPGAWTAFAKLGGDLGVSNSWQLGVSYISADAEERGGGHHHEDDMESGFELEEEASFSGDSDLAIVDLVWKWAPLGNNSVRSLKLQGEFFWRSEDGSYGEQDYDYDQSGWYVQGVMQFAPNWRTGLRYDLVDAGSDNSLVGTELEGPRRDSKRTSVMLDWSASEFSRIRLQYIRDEVLEDAQNQWVLQYIMSLGAHGTHQF